MIRRTPQAGFTLLEVLVAFTLFGILVGSLLQVLVGAMRGTSYSDEYTQASLWAQSKLAAVGIEEPLEEGESEGDFDEEYRWRLIVSSYEGESEGDNVITFDALPAVELYRVELQVSWQQRGVRERQTSFITLRSAVAEQRR